MRIALERLIAFVSASTEGTEPTCCDTRAGVSAHQRSDCVPRTPLSERIKRILARVGTHRAERNHIAQIFFRPPIEQIHSAAVALRLTACPRIGLRFAYAVERANQANLARVGTHRAERNQIDQIFFRPPIERIHSPRYRVTFNGVPADRIVFRVRR